jgi:hypothetical protein
MGADKPEVMIPGRAVAYDEAAGKDLSQPVSDLLQRLNLLPNDDQLAEARGFVSAFAGSPQSVAVIESTATALSKWWAAGLSAAVGSAWAALRVFWDQIPASVQPSLLISLAVVSAAVVLAVGHILAQDVRGRSVASVATIEARASVARTMMGSSERSYKQSSEVPSTQLVSLPAGTIVRWTAKTGDLEESGWLALALKIEGDNNFFKIAKDKTHAWVPESEIQFDGPLGRHAISAPYQAGRNRNRGLKRRGSQ